MSTLLLKSSRRMACSVVNCATVAILEGGDGKYTPPCLHNPNRATYIYTKNRALITVTPVSVKGQTV